MSPLQLSRFDYHLPEDLIAQEPVADRKGSRLLHLDAAGKLHDLQFTDFVSLLKPGDLLVFNDTRVIKARLTGRKASGGKLEVLVERIIDEHRALAHIRSSRAPRPGTRILLADDQITAMVTGRQQALFQLEFDRPVLPALEACGTIPLPPYITRPAATHDEQRYQTVYARQPGAVAAPTAGLHFDETMLAQLDPLSVQHAFVTLHVGAGTFQPVREANIQDHTMHAEWYEVPPHTLESVRAARQRGARVIAIGTTSARALESAALQLEQASDNPDTVNTGLRGDTRLFITPGYTFRWVDAMLTNFHLPQSTLLMMVSALAGMEPIRQAYAHAVAGRYRFFSYGDAMFIEPPSTPS